MNAAEEAGLARAQATLFGVAARCLSRPDAALVADLAAGRVSAALEGALRLAAGGPSPGILDGVRECEALCAASESDEARLRLEVDYNRLFVGPAALLAPPYESYYATAACGCGAGRLRADEERAVGRAYARQGFAVPQRASEPVDHAAFELEFLSRLALDEARAWEEGDEAPALDAQRAQAAFIVEHLGTWIAPFAERVCAGARTPLYPATARLIAAFCS